MPLPNLLCIGAQKAGTSWLYAQLGRHPDVWMPPVKELHFFDHVYVEQNRKWTSTHIRDGALRVLKWHLANVKTPEWAYIRYLTDMATRNLFSEVWYRRCFDRTKAEGKVVCDITPEYSCIPEEGIEYLKSLLPGVKILYILRDPVERALSQLRMAVERRGLAPDEANLLPLCDEWDIANRGDYRTYVPRWKARFPADRLMVLPYGRIGKDPRGFMREVEAFAGLPECHRYELDKKVHVTKSIPVPERVVEKLERLCAGQREFLSAEFGAEFCALTR